MEVTDSEAGEALSRWRGCMLVRSDVDGVEEEDGGSDGRRRRLPWWLSSLEELRGGDNSMLFLLQMLELDLSVPGSSEKCLTGKRGKLTYSPAVGCKWLCLAGV